MEEADERLSGTFSSSSASTDLPPLNSEMQADAMRIAAIMTGGGNNARQSNGGGTSNASDTPFTVVRTSHFPPTHNSTAVKKTYSLYCHQNGVARETFVKQGRQLTMILVYIVE